MDLPLDIQIRAKEDRDRGRLKSNRGYAALSGPCTNQNKAVAS